MTIHHLYFSILDNQYYYSMGRIMECEKAIVYRMNNKK